MPHSLQDLRRFAVVATDGTVGAIEDLLFDDRDSRVRYLVVDTAGWLRHRPVLIAPQQIERIDTEARRLRLSLDRESLERCLPLDMHPPVSRQVEGRMREHFGLQPITATVPCYEFAFWGPCPSRPSGKRRRRRSRRRSRPGSTSRARSTRICAARARSSTIGCRERTSASAT